MTDTTVSQTILQQLGGRRFTVMTGAKNFTALDDYTLRFMIPGSGGRTKKGINVVEIRLEASDTYTMRFLRLRRKNGMPDLVEVEKREDIYNDVLPEVFERVTGLATRL